MAGPPVGEGHVPAAVLVRGVRQELVDAVHTARTDPGIVGVPGDLSARLAGSLENAAQNSAIIVRITTLAPPSECAAMSSRPLHPASAVATESTELEVSVCAETRCSWAQAW